MISIGVSLTLWACSKAPRLREGVRWEMPAGCGSAEWLLRSSRCHRHHGLWGVVACLFLSDDEGVQGCKHREGAVRRPWGAFLDSSGEEKGFLKF